MSDAAFTGNVPEMYARDLVPLLFAPWAELVARRVAAARPARILETAAGTGVVTRALAEACPDAQIVATDLNEAMLDVAARDTGENRRITFAAADATALPFDDESFDAAACQFGIMFFPDRVKGYAEAARVLKPGAPLVATLWGSLDENPVSACVHRAVGAVFPGDPPQFLARTPFGHHDADRVIAECEAGGFELVSVERITLSHGALDARSAADGLVLGSPLRAEIEAHGAGALDRALAAARGALAEVSDGEGRIAASMTALVVTAQR
ncbi:methyltransferase domain-containing protein [Sphingomonas sp. ASV193]|uniref:methyltransferase domain-containing protein n=1 Tax=Sphingomonas sp. ASV193 TaxID=3144405 RepID=UPI0032E8953F